MSLVLVFFSHSQGGWCSGYLLVFSRHQVDLGVGHGTQVVVSCSQRRSNKLVHPPRDHRRWLGTFNTAEEAAVVYDLRKRQIKGEHTKCNFAALDDSGELGTLSDGSVCGFKRDHQYWEPQMVEGGQELTVLGAGLLPDSR